MQRFICVICDNDEDSAKYNDISEEKGGNYLVKWEINGNFVAIKALVLLVMKIQNGYQI